MDPAGAERRIQELVALLEGSAVRDYIGEGVSQLQHALQTAALASEAGAPEAEVLAALLHDIGHLCAGAGNVKMGDLGIADHETIGADHLEALGFGSEVTELVRGHVQAKRYLVATNADYEGRLSTASRGSLAHQAGAMSGVECRVFDGDPRRDAKMRLRSWDDAAKVPNRKVPELDTYIPLLRAHLQAPLANAE